MEYIFVPYSFKKDGIYYFVRRIPAELQHHYDQKKVSYSLRTKSPKLAAKRSLIAASQLDEYWDKLRDDEDKVPVQHYSITDSKRDVGKQSRVDPVDHGSTISQATKLYIRLKGHNRPKTFEAGANRACKYLVEVVGDKKIGQLKKADATSFRDALMERGLAGSSIARVFNNVKAIISFAINETGLDMTNPFKDVYYDRQVGVKDRLPFTPTEIKRIQVECRKLDDDLRWLIAIVSDTGMRLAEAVGLNISDIHLDEEIPFVRIQPHPWRRLKTKSSERDVPLVGASLWAAQRIVANSKSEFAFDRYSSVEGSNANSASAATNKWLKQSLHVDRSMHSFRHSMRDRLRDVGCPTELVDQIGGWSKDANVGQSYGVGYRLATMHHWLSQTIA